MMLQRESTANEVFSCLKVGDYFDASALAGGGKITFKLYTNDPSRIVSDVLPSQPQIRLCFCSDGEDPIDWTQNTDNFMIWDLQEYPLKANEWNTIEIEYDQAARYGRFDPAELELFQHPGWYQRRGGTLYSAFGRFANSAEYV